MAKRIAALPPCAIGVVGEGAGGVVVDQMMVRRLCRRADDEGVAGHGTDGQRGEVEAVERDGVDPCGEVGDHVGVAGDQRSREDERVLTGAAGKPVDSGPTHHLIVAAAALQFVVAGLTVHAVVAGPSVDRVVPGASDELIVALVAEQPVGQRGSDDAFDVDVAIALGLSGIARDVVEVEQDRLSGFRV